MGEVSIRKISFNEVTSVLRPLERAQIYLLEAAELNVLPWSKKSSDELIQTYASTLAAIATPLLKDSDEISAARKQQEDQWGLAQDFFNVLDQLKIHEQPDSENQNPFVKAIFKSVAETKEKLVELLHTPKIGQDLTDSSKARTRTRLQPNTIPKKKMSPPIPTSDPNL